jgi:hypothetical protein
MPAFADLVWTADRVDLVLPEHRDVRLELTVLEGQLKARFVQGIEQAANHRVRDGEQAPSGLAHVEPAGEAVGRFGGAAGLDQAARGLADLVVVPVKFGLDQLPIGLGKNVDNRHRVSRRCLSCSGSKGMALTVPDPWYPRPGPSLGVAKHPSPATASGSQLLRTSPSE